MVEAYLPKAPDEAAIRAIASAVIAEKGLKGPAAMGVAIKETMARLAGAADGKVVTPHRRRAAQGLTPRRGRVERPADVG